MAASTVENPDPLSQLRDIHLPADPHWWPPAPGWWFLLLLMALVVAGVIWVAWRTLRHRRPARLAKHGITAIERRCRKDADTVRAARELSTLLRRYLLCRFPRETVAGLCGARWRRFLGDILGDSWPVGDDVVALLESPYRPDTEEVGTLITLIVEVIDATTEPIHRAVFRSSGAGT